MDIKLVVAVALTGMMVSSCATVVKGSGQDIAVNSAPVDGADCDLQNSEGAWHLTTPGTAHIAKTKHVLTITCRKQGYQDASGTVRSKFQGWTLGNIILGGAIGFGIDAATGAMREYPLAYTMQMTPILPPSSVSGSVPAAPPPSKEPVAQPSS